MSKHLNIVWNSFHGFETISRIGHYSNIMLPFHFCLYYSGLPFSLPQFRLNISLEIIFSTPMGSRVSLLFPYILSIYISLSLLKSVEYTNLPGLERGQNQASVLCLGPSLVLLLTFMRTDGWLANQSIQLVK